MNRFSKVEWKSILLLVAAACVVWGQGPAARADVLMFISNYSSSTASPLAYDTSTHTITTIDTGKSQIASTFVGPDPSNHSQFDLFAAQGLGGHSTIYTYPFNPVTQTFGAASAFVSGMTGEARGMAYSPLNNMIYLTTDDNTFGQVQQITAGGVGAGTLGTPITPGGRPFGVTVDSSGVVWIATYPNGLYRYDPSVPATPPSLVLSVPGSLFAREAIAPANFDGGAYTGDIFIADVARNVVEFYNPVTTASGALPDSGGLVDGAAGIGFNPLTGDLYVTNSNNNTVVEYNTGSAQFQYAANLGPGNGILNGPNDLSFFIVPEPISMSLVALGSMMLLTRPRRVG